MTEACLSQTDARPGAVAGAMSILVLDAVTTAASVHILFWLSSNSRGWVLPFQPGVWILALLQAFLALLIFRASNWARWLVAVVVAFQVGDSLLNTSLNARFHSFPATTVRDLQSYGLQVVAMALLFLPTSSAWFRNSARREGNA